METAHAICTFCKKRLQHLCDQEVSAILPLLEELCYSKTATCQQVCKMFKDFWKMSSEQTYSYKRGAWRKTPILSHLHTGPFVSPPTRPCPTQHPPKYALGQRSNQAPNPKPAHPMTKRSGFGQEFSPTQKMIFQLVFYAYCPNVTREKQFQCWTARVQTNVSDKKVVVTNRPIKVLLIKQTHQSTTNYCSKYITGEWHSFQATYLWSLWSWHLLTLSFVHQAHNMCTIYCVRTCRAIKRSKRQ